MEKEKGGGRKVEIEKMGDLEFWEKGKRTTKWVYPRWRYGRPFMATWSD